MKSRLPTLEDLKKTACAPLNQHVFRKVEKSKKKSKYNNTKTEVDGIVFDSVKEANRYKELRLLLKVGEIGLLKRQIEYELNPGGTYSLKYVSDFEYIIRATGDRIVEDVKGYRTKEYLKKRRLMQKVHGIKIIEI
jgi:hypothetical protein